MVTSPPLYTIIAQNPEVFQKVLLEEFEHEGDMDFEG